MQTRKYGGGYPMPFIFLRQHNQRGKKTVLFYLPGNCDFLGQFLLKMELGDFE